MEKILIATLLAMTASTASAGWSVGTVKSYLVMRYGKFFFTAGANQDTASCNLAGEWAVDINGSEAAAGKAIMAAIMAAHMSGKNVRVIGKGVCDAWGDRETVEYVVVE